MENVLYRKFLVPSDEALDGETPIRIVVTAEFNCTLVWLTHCDGDDLLAYFTHSRDKALEFAVAADLNTPIIGERRR